MMKDLRFTMTLRIKDLTIPVQAMQDDNAVLSALATKLSIPPETILSHTIRKKSLDARKKGRIVYHLQVDFSCEDEQSLATRFSELEQAPPMPVLDPLQDIDFSKAQFRHPPVIIGSGPAGTFAALTLARAGIKSIIVDRGEAVEQRLRTGNRLRREGHLNPESNFCFGEGGAGTFSDGKLTCGRNHPLIRHIFNEFVAYGAPDSILYDAHPHIGTDYLMRISQRMRASLQNIGCEYLFERRMDDFTTGSSHARYIVRLHDGTQIPTDHLILAIGHSARDTYKMLQQKKVAMVPKPFAMGARVEHPQELINQIQFGACELPTAAEYKLTAQTETRGIWTFCMCPGGNLLPTSAQAGHLAINGMSYHARNSGFANAAIVVSVRKEDFYRDDALDGMRFQEKIEQLAFQEGGGNYFSPAQRLEDFIAGRTSKGEMKSTYKPGITSARLDRILPSFASEALRVALGDYNKRMKGFISEHALIVGVESKTSAPVSLLRNDGLESQSHPGFFPAGEGAGYAGGIISAALDGVRIGQAVLRNALSTHP